MITLLLVAGAGWTLHRCWVANAQIDDALARLIPDTKDADLMRGSTTSE